MHRRIDGGDLSTRLRAGDRTVVRELYGCYGRLMFAVAMRVLGNRTLAEDATQQAFLQAWKGRETIDASRDVRPWLCAITQRAAIDIGRRESHRAHDTLDDDRPHPELVSHPDLEAA